jgi:hypothetical protein
VKMALIGKTGARGNRSAIRDRAWVRAPPANLVWPHQWS